MFLSGCSDKIVETVNIVPEPESVVVGVGKVRVSGFKYDTKDDQMSELVSRFHNLVTMPKDGDGIDVGLKIVDSLTAQQYHININNKNSFIDAGSYQAMMYGLLTLLQIYDGNLPVVEIWDKPQFEYRGAMLDASRHFWTVDEVKRFIDILAYHKMNKFHWHLTDGIGWRIEIKQYPELTRRGAWRKELRKEAPWTSWELSTADDSLAYGGFYSQEDVREIVAYAGTQFIEVIPEIEMPGHSDAALECYPELKCFHGESKTGEYCAGKEETYKFLANVLDEVAGLFPSQYIHVGGDEVNFENWALCVDCQKRLKSEKIFGADKLQGYFMERIVNHLKSRDKIVCGWDEITDYTLNQNVVVYSWTGQEAGAKAANSGHKVVMVPIDYLYFDHYQGVNNAEPQAWGGMNNLKRVYGLNVIPKSVIADSAKNIIGAQANLWTENITTFNHVEYMLLPRLAALSEVLWSKNENRDWNKFAEKIPTLVKKYKALGWNYSSALVDPYVANQWFDDNADLNVELGNELNDYDIRYTLDGSKPNGNSELYSQNIIIDSEVSLIAGAFKDDSLVSRLLVLNDLKSKSTGKSVTYNSKYSKDYSGGGEWALTDSKSAFKKGDDKSWQGFESVNMDIIVDLGDVEEISEVNVRFFQHMGATSVMLPKIVEVKVSEDGVSWEKIAEQQIGYINNFDAIIYTAKLDFVKVKTRYVNVIGVNIKYLPPWHMRFKQNAWIFADEISIN